ncbi:TPA: LysR substrate-binding domain-containing protein [Escherichia coli]
MRNRLPLNGLRAFEASARHLNFTRAGLELHVSQAAVSQQVRSLENLLNVNLFRRLPRGLVLTEEGAHLLPILNDAFNRMDSALQKFRGGKFLEVLTVAVVGTFAIGWLLPRLKDFYEKYPWIDLRILTHNNTINLANEGIDASIRFGEGKWTLTENIELFAAPHTVLCSPVVAENLLSPKHLRYKLLFRTYRQDEWYQWLEVAGVEPWVITGPIFDSSRLMIDATTISDGIALAPSCMFKRELDLGLLKIPFDIHVNMGSYWMTTLKSKQKSAALTAFSTWLQECCL